MENKTKKRIDPASASWDLFTKTGEISYYMLYKKLTTYRYSIDIVQAMP